MVGAVGEAAKNILSLIHQLSVVISDDTGKVETCLDVRLFAVLQDPNELQILVQPEVIAALAKILGVLPGYQPAIVVPQMLVEIDRGMVKAAVVAET
jgi:hypothetical protein